MSYYTRVCPSPLFPAARLRWERVAIFFSGYSVYSCMVAVTVWNENQHERATGPANAMYPDGIHTTLAETLTSYGHTVQTATLDDPAHGLTETVLAETDVLLWWSDIAHDVVSDATANRVEQAVRDGMGFIPLHSSHESKPFGSDRGVPLVARGGRAREVCGRSDC